MPTGYTQGIIDGTIKDFKQYAKLCEKAFAIHLKEEPFSNEWIPRTPDDYHIKGIEKAKNTLNEIKDLEDNEIINNEKLRLLDEIEYHKINIEKQKQTKITLEKFLLEAKAFKAPTEKHNGIAEFMIRQIEKTIDFDCNNTQHKDLLEKYEKELLNIDAFKVRVRLKSKVSEDLIYHTKQYKSELKRCEDTNKWHEDFINALD